MNRPRLSVAAMMGLVGFVAVAIAALTSPAPLLAGAALMATLGLLAVAVLGVIFDRCAGRAFWSGFAIIGWGYMALIFAPWLRESFAPRLATTMLADLLYRQLSHTPKVGETVWTDFVIETLDRTPEGKIEGIDTESKPFPVYNFVLPGRPEMGFTPTPVFLTERQVKTIDRGAYRELMHCLACPIFALLGGLAARRFAARGSLRRSPPEMTSAPHPGIPPCDAP